jgi:putative tryptophan/tyrosine transport system substrate-binding protein
MPLGKVDRRVFIARLSGAITAWPLAARGQQREHVRRIGVLMQLATDDPEGQRRLVAFVQGLQEAGWVLGHNINIDV